MKRRPSTMRDSIEAETTPVRRKRQPYQASADELASAGVTSAHTLYETVDAIAKDRWGFGLSISEYPSCRKEFRRLALLLRKFTQHRPAG